MSFNTPILFLIFNRPDTTKKVFETIRKIKPKELFIAADGPRIDRVDDDKLCEKTRKITERIDWRCKVHRLYRSSNLGCGHSVSEAISWFFNHVERGIILEDDCLPNRTFFYFCEDMLEKYKNDETVMCISGNNFLPDSYINRRSYYMSSYPHIWGWASWRRAWLKYDFNMSSWRKMGLFQKVKSIDGGMFNKFYWTSMFDGATKRYIDTWDYQWIFANFKHRAKTVFPGVNLVSNIGFSKSATHTRSGIKVETLSITSNPVYIDMGTRIDKYEVNNIFNVLSVKTLIRFFYYCIIK